MNLQLRDILDAFVCLRPDVGYVQGMSYIGAIICLYIDSPYVGGAPRPLHTHTPTHTALSPCSLCVTFATPVELVLAAWCPQLGVRHTHTPRPLVAVPLT